MFFLIIDDKQKSWKAYTSPFALLIYEGMREFWNVFGCSYASRFDVCSKTFMANLIHSKMRKLIKQDRVTCSAKWNQMRGRNEKSMKKITGWRAGEHEKQAQSEQP